MISKQNLQLYTRTLRYSLAQVEKDFLQHLFLFNLYIESSTLFVFKGGTALQKCFGLDRFSEDLDFTYTGNDKFIENIISRVASNFSILYDTELKKEIKGQKSDSINYVLKIKGPLYSGKELSHCFLRIDISMREKILNEPILVKIVPEYQLLRPYTAHVMSYEEILAEKIRAICTRTKARDVYDLWYLVKKGIKIKEPLVEEKLTYYNVELTKELITEKILEKEKIWNKELEIIVKNVPDFNKISTDLIALF